MKKLLITLSFATLIFSCDNPEENTINNPKNISLTVDSSIGIGFETTLYQGRFIVYDEPSEVTECAFEETKILFDTFPVFIQYTDTSVKLKVINDSIFEEIDSNSYIMLGHQVNKKINTLCHHWQNENNITVKTKTSFFKYLNAEKTPINKNFVIINIQKRK